MYDISERLARIVENDGSGTVNRTMRVMQSDVLTLLGEFMDVQKLDVRLDRSSDNGYDLTITAKVARIYDVGKTTETE